MPNRALAITTRHHPVAVSCYLGLALLAVLYLLDIANAPSMSDETNNAWVLVWQASLLLGGVVALVGVFVPVKWLLYGLVAEALGAMVLGIELGVYVVVLSISGPAAPWASVLVFGAVATGCLCRAYTAMRDRRRVLSSALSSRSATVLAESEQ